MSNSATAERELAADANRLQCDRPMPMNPLPLTPLESFLLRSATPESPMVIQVVLRFTGECQPEVYVQTLQQAMERHPLLSCRIQQIDRQWCWVAGSPEPISICRKRGSIFELECGVRSKFIDLTTSTGLHTSIIVLDDGVKVILDLHHAVADGNGLRQLVTEWFHFYHCAVKGTQTKLPVTDPDRLKKRHLFLQPQSVPPISFKQAMANFWVTIRGRTARWHVTGENRSRHSDHQSSYCAEIILSDEQGDLIRERMSAWGVKLNEFVMACSMSTFALLSPPGRMNDRISVFNPIDMRMPSDRTLSAANRFGVAFMRRVRSECLVPEAVLRGLHDEMTYVRSNGVGVEFIKGLATASKIPRGIDMFRRLGLLIPSLQLTTLGDVVRGGKRLVPCENGKPVIGGLKLVTTTGFAPYADDVPLSIATCETGKTLVLTVRSSPRFLTVEQTQEVATKLVQQLCDFEMPREQNASG